jgi:broad specificity phosphatase PhoE
MRANASFLRALMVALAIFIVGAVPVPATADATTPVATTAGVLHIYIARHGETAWNAEHRLQGQTDIPLNDKGRQQARALHELMAGVRLDHVYSSNLSRSHETALIATGGVEPEQLRDLGERNFGKFQGKVSVAPDVKPEWDARSKDPDDALDGGESRTQFHERVQRALKQILAAYPRGGTILIVAHGGTNQQLLRSLLDLTDAESQLIDESNDEVYLVEVATGNAAATPPTLWKRVTREHLNDL